MTTIVERSHSSESHGRRIQRTLPAEARTNRKAYNRNNRHAAILTVADEQFIQQHVLRLQEKHGEVLKKEMQCAMNFELEKLKRRADQYCSFTNTDNPLKTPSKKQSGNPYKLASAVASIISTELANLERNIMQLKLTAFARLKQRPEKQVVRSKSTTNKQKFIADDDIESEEDHQLMKTQTKTGFRKKHELVITYNLYEIDARDLLKSHDGMLILNKLPNPVASKIYSGKDIQVVQDDFELEEDDTLI